MCAGKFAVPFESQGLAPHLRDGAKLAELPREPNVAGADPIVSGMAGRYATALFELARDEKAVDAVKGDLDRFDALLADNADLLRVVRSPVFSTDEQLKALSAILDRGTIGGLAANFLKLLARNRRLYAVRNVIKV